MMKLKFQYFGHLIRRVDLSEKTLMLGKLKAKGEEGQRMRWLGSITDSMGMNLREFLVIVRDRGTWRAAKSWKRDSD